MLLSRRFEQNSASTKIWKMVEGGDYCCEVHPGCYQYWYLHFPGRCQLAAKTVGKMDLEERPGSCERTGAPVLWLSCEGQIDVWKLFSDNSYLGALLDRQGLMVAAPADRRIKRAEGFSPQALQSFSSKIKYDANCLY